MPEVSRCFRIVIKIYFDEHKPPHFHAECGGDLAPIDPRSLAAFSVRSTPPNPVPAKTSDAVSHCGKWRYEQSPKSSGAQTEYRVYPPLPTMGEIHWQITLRLLKYFLSQMVVINAISKTQTRSEISGQRLRLGLLTAFLAMV